MNKEKLKDFTDFFNREIIPIMSSDKDKFKELKKLIQHRKDKLKNGQRRI